MFSSHLVPLLSRNSKRLGSRIWAISSLAWALRNSRAHVQVKQHQAYGDDYTDPYSQTQGYSRSLHGRQEPQWNHQKNRQPDHPSILAPKADTQRLQKNSPQRVPPGRNCSNQHFLENAKLLSRSEYYVQEARLLELRIMGPQGPILK